MVDKLTLGVGQAHEVEMAMNRVGDWTNSLVKAACGGDHLGRFRDVLLNRAEIVPVPIQPPDGGKICILTIPVDGNRKWRNAVTVVGRDTGRDWSIWNVGDQCPPDGRVGLREVILVNFGPGSLTTGPQAVAWGKNHGLRPETPRAVFAVAEYRPLLYRELGVGAIGIVSTIPCSFDGDERVPYAWLGDAERSARLDKFARDWRGNCSFAFGRE